MFFVKSAFWLAMILLLLPIDREAAGIAQGPSTFQTVAALGTVVSDMRGFCDRNPSTCATGAATMDVLRQKAVYSAGRVQSWLGEGDGQTIHVNHPESAPMAGDDQVAALIRAADERIPASDYPPL